MHRSMTKEVVKKLVVSIKRMEEDLNFYENNWDQFQSPQLDYVKELEDLDQQVAKGHQGANSLRNLHYPEIIKEESEPYRSFDGRKDSSRMLEEKGVVKDKPLLKNVPRRKIYHH